MKSLKNFARRVYQMNDGRKLRVVMNPHIKQFQLLLNKKVLKQSRYFNEIDRKFKKIMRKDKRFFG